MGFAGISICSTRLSTGVERWLVATFHAPSRLWILIVREVSCSGGVAAPLYWSPGRRCGRFDTLISREANVPAECTPAEAPARIPGADVNARGSGDPEAPPRQGPQAPLRVRGSSEPPPASSIPLPRLRHRLSQGPVGIDAVPRPLRVSTRGRPARAARVSAWRSPANSVGAVERNRLKRRLRASFEEVCGAAAVRPRLRAHRAAGPDRGGREPRLPLAHRARRRDLPSRGGDGRRVRHVVALPIHAYRCS